MIVDDFDLKGVSVAPAEADPPLVVDPDAVLPFALARQAFQPIAWRGREIVQAAGIVDLRQFWFADSMMSFGMPFINRRSQAAWAAAFRNDLIIADANAMR